MCMSSAVKFPDWPIQVDSLRDREVRHCRGFARGASMAHEAPQDEPSKKGEASSGVYHSWEGG